MPNLTPVKVGTTVRTLRTAKGWSQAELARRSGIGQRTIVRIEGGEDTTIGTLDAIAKALKVKTVELLGRAS